MLVSPLQAQFKAPMKPAKSAAFSGGRLSDQAANRLEKGRETIQPAVFIVLDRLYTRGNFDQKTALAELIKVALELPREKPQFSTPVVLATLKANKLVAENDSFDFVYRELIKDWFAERAKADHEAMAKFMQIPIVAVLDRIHAHGKTPQKLSLAELIRVANEPPAKKIKFTIVQASEILKNEGLLAPDGTFNDVYRTLVQRWFEKKRVIRLRARRRKHEQNQPPKGLWAMLNRVGRARRLKRIKAQRATIPQRVRK